MKNIFKNFNFSLLLLYLFPIFLITGPAIPDISLTLISILFLFYVVRNKKYELFNIIWFKVGILLWLWFIFISFFAHNKYLSFIDAIFFIRFLIFILAIHISIIYSETIRKNLIKIIFIFLIFVTIDSFYQFFNYSPEYGFLNDIIGRKPEGLYGRLSGPFKDLIPGSIIAKFFFISLLLFINKNYFVINEYNKSYYFKNIFFIIFFSTAIAVTYLSGERIAFATLFLGILITLTLLKDFRIKLITCSFASVLLIYLITIFHPIYNDYKIIESSSKHEGLIVKKEFVCEDDKFKKCNKIIAVQPKFIKVIKEFNKSSYGEIYNTALNIWKDNIIFGVGLNNYTFVCEKNEKYDIFHKNIPCTTHPHNFYIQALVETGLVGLIIFISFVLSFFITIIKSNQSKNYKVIFIISLIVVFWPIMSTGSFLKNFHMATICFLLGICLSNPNKESY